ncbi:MAG: STAS domain-containing protein [Candidatus Latescibacteria bacterium]|nr:STAS domain-containing protein [Candidatus Latescibacterota bacterium]
MSHHMEVYLRQIGDIVFIDIAGDVTAFAEEKLTQAYQSASEKGTRKIVLNFKEDAYINSAGIAIIIGIATESRRKEDAVVIVQPSKHFQKIFSMIGLTRYLKIFENEREALSGL